MIPEIRRNLYVDNLFFGTQSPSEALAKYKYTKNLFQELKMNLREYRSNDKCFNDTINGIDRMKSSNPKVLGIPWNTDRDKIIIKGSMTPSIGKTTKCTVTQQLASVYDPMGLLVPLLLPAKEQWRQITTEISTFYKEVQRRISNNSSEHRLIVFTDASQCAIAACAYLVLQENSNIIMARSKIPSIKTAMTIPKLEINALTLGVRTLRLICEALEPLCKTTELIFYTDSDIALVWIKTPPSRQSAGVLVSNQLAEIRRINNGLKSNNIVCLFGHVQTAENPADCNKRINGGTATET